MKIIIFIIVFLFSGTLTFHLNPQIDILHSFRDVYPDGYLPESSLILNGTTLFGTAISSDSGRGAIFKIETDGSGYNIMHFFQGSPNDGETPRGSLLLDGTTLYGMTYLGGFFDEGIIFKIETDGSNYKVIHHFAGAPNDGANPNGSLIIDGSTLYGMTKYGGNNFDSGTIFKIQTDGSGFYIIHSFDSFLGDGSSPYGSLLLKGATLCGMTTSGGYYGGGTVFKIETDGSDYTILHNFSFSEKDGWKPLGSLILDGTTLYGMSQYGGSYNFGTIFRLESDGSGYTLLHYFSCFPYDGCLPRDSLVIDGNTLYGMTAFCPGHDLGKIFKIDTDGSKYNILHSFNGAPNDGDDPMGSFVINGGTLYGTTCQGGANDFGIIFAYNIPPIIINIPNGNENWLIGAIENITWDASALSNDIHIVLQENGINVALIAKNLDPALGAYSWTVGDCIKGTVNDGTHYKILVKVKGTTIQDTSDESFTILHPSINVTSPNGGETWTRGTIENITWNSWILPGDSLIIGLLKPNGRPIMKIADNVDPTIGSYSWAIQTILPTRDYKIKIKVKRKAISDISDAPFTLKD